MSMFIELPNYVDKKLIEEIRSSVKPYMSSNKHHGYNRDGFTVNISRTPELKELDLKISRLCAKLQGDVVYNRYNPPFPSGSSDFEYHLYEPNDICNIHADNEIVFDRAETSALIRYASVVIHLNDVLDGGELIFPNQNVRIKTEEGKVVVFPPYGMLPHYTTPAKTKREVVVTWFVYSGINAIKV